MTDQSTTRAREVTEPKSAAGLVDHVLRKHGFYWQAECADITGTIGADLIAVVLSYAAERESEIERLSYLLACVADHATGGMLSKTNYDKTVYYDYIDDHVERCAQEAVKEALEEQQARLRSRPATEGKREDE